MLSRPKLILLVLFIAVFACSSLATPQARRGGKITPETLVPEEVFPDKDAKRFGYPDGAIVTYESTPEFHNWLLNAPPREAEPDAAPTPSPTPAAVSDEDQTLPPTLDEPLFTLNVGYFRPTVVRVRWMTSPQEASAFVNQAYERFANKENRSEFLVVPDLNRDPGLGGFVYSREYNLGAKTGGMKRGTLLYAARGNVVVSVDALLGLKDTARDADFDVLEARARKVMAYLVPKL